MVMKKVDRREKTLFHDVYTPKVHSHHCTLHQMSNSSAHTVFLAQLKPSSNFTSLLFLNCSQYIKFDRQPNPIYNNLQKKLLPTCVASNNIDT